MISEDNQKQLDRFKNKPPHPSYIAGFIDGDGCVFIRKISDGYQSGFTISQCRTNVLQIIRYHFGGNITSSNNRNDKTINIMNDDDYYYKYNIRNQYNLLIRNNEYKIILEYLQESFIIKERQYQCLYQFNKIANLTNKNEEKEQLYLLCSTHNKKCELDKSNLSRLNIEYISGLFDAEGCLFIKKKTLNCFITISQKNHPLILEEIIKFLGFGKILPTEIRIYKQCDCLKFIRLVKNHLIVKYNQAKAFEIFLETKDTNIKEQMYTICNKEKHEIELFTILNKNENGKERYLENIRLRSIKDKICKEIKLKQVYREKSEKMKGCCNHNFGKNFSQETKKKMSDSIRDSKGGVSDEIIIKVRNLIYEGHKNIEIQELLNLQRHTITRIKNGTIVCRNEEKTLKHPLTQIENNLSKRKITSNEIIIVIEKFIEQWKPSQILDYLIEIRNKNNIQNNLTIDIIKNIKRNIKNEKHVIYDSELPKEKYEYYVALFNKFKEYLI
jgi:hypothetical protein